MFFSGGSLSDLVSQLILNYFDLDAGLSVFMFDSDKARCAAPPFEEVRNISGIKL